MTIYLWITVVSWIVFICFWLISAVSAKKTIRSRSGLTIWIHVAIRIVAFLVVIALIHEQILTRSMFALTNDTSNPVLGILGVVCSVVGVAFAIWARVYLGRNWGMPMTLKENRELVTSGPYRFVRHPIYTGILLAMIGSTLVQGLFWLVVFVFAAFYFIYSAVTEEKVLTKEFPEAYPTYKKRSKMLIPFIF
jgi:protein-S-isoprenylcysteine O-methyltransferase Ste14